MAKKYWLMKSEPETYSISDFKKDKKARWDGIRNYQARNFMMNDMSIGDEFIFYHSNATPPCAAGVGKVSAPAEIDVTAFDKKSKYFDPKSSKDKPRWYCVEVKFEKAFANPVPLAEIKAEKNLQKMMLIKRGMRLSIQPVTEKEFKHVCKMGEG